MVKTDPEGREVPPSRQKELLKILISLTVTSRQVRMLTPNLARTTNSDIRMGDTRGNFQVSILHRPTTRYQALDLTDTQYLYNNILTI